MSSLYSLLFVEAGYAFQWKDESSSYTIIGDSPAGSQERLSVKYGEAIKTFTGSLMPVGADTLIPVEHATVSDDCLTFDKSVRVGDNVRPIGDNFKKGECLLSCGATLGPAEIGLLASLGMSLVKVMIKPRVAVISFGDELNCEIQENPEFPGFKLTVTVALSGKTGVEMEALTGTSIGLLTIYDMVKAIDKNMVISEIALEEKSGGNSGLYKRDKL